MCEIYIEKNKVLADERQINDRFDMKDLTWAEKKTVVELRKKIFKSKLQEKRNK